MSTEYGEIKCPLFESTLEVYTSNGVRILVKDKDNGIKITMTEETWRKLITILEVAGNQYKWEP